MGNSGEAVLWYNRALALDPGYAEARQNKRFLQRKLGFHERPRPTVPLTESQAKILRAAGLWVGLLALGGLIFLGRTPIRTLFLTLALFFGFLLSGAVWLLLWKRGPEPDLMTQATIISESAAMSAPTDSSTQLLALPPGSKVTVVERRGDWIYLEVAGEEMIRGWTKASTLEMILQPSEADA